MCAGGGGVAAAVTNMIKKGRGLKCFGNLAHQWAADYFLVRMVVPGTKPVENPWFSPFGHKCFIVLAALDI